VSYSSRRSSGRAGDLAALVLRLGDVSHAVHAELLELE
jgi:hypothetical protein